MFLGGLTGLKAGTQGNIVFMAEEPLALNSVRYRNYPFPMEMRLLYHGFSAAEGDDEYVIPTVLYNKFNRITVFGIQNLESASIYAVIEFYDADHGGALSSTITHTIPAYSSIQIDMDNWQETGLTYTDNGVQAAHTVFNGTALITAKMVSGGAPADIVASASEYYVRRPVAADFEGVPIGDAGDTVYLATALCERYGMDTWYAVTNVGDTATSVTIQYYELDGTSAGSQTTGTLDKGEKASIHTCAGTNISSDFSGSAVLTANSQGAQIVALGKAQEQLNNPPNGDKKDFVTIFRGQPAGSDKLSFPFVRWANNTQFTGTTKTYQRSYLAIQNVSGGEIDIKVSFYDRNGELRGAQTIYDIASMSKVNVNPQSADEAVGGILGDPDDPHDMVEDAFGYYTDGGFGGAVLIQIWSSGGNFIAINRTNHVLEGQSMAGEDVNGVPVP